MAGEIRFESNGTLLVVTLSQPGRFNAMSRAMWQQLRSGFEQLRQDAALRCVLVRGDGGHFCAGGDIAEYTEFRFDPDRLRDFHENLVWGALQSMRDCEIPLLAEIDGNCIGAGLEIASCCDIRIAGVSARFGAPIARLGFPMAPRELGLVLSQVGATAARQMLLEAAVLDAPRMLQLGFLGHLVEDAGLQAHVQATQLRIRALAPQAARMNKRTIRALSAITEMAGSLGTADALAALVAGAYDYADSGEHREGIAAFVAKRKPAF